MSILTNRELAVLLCTLPDSVPRLSEMEDRLAIGPEYGSPWYSSQKEHMIGWAADFEGPGAYLRRATGLSSARKLYSQLVCTPALYWLIAASGVNEEIYGYAWEKAMLRPQIRMASRSGQLRTAVPWHFVNIALRRREPVSRMEWILALDVIVAAQRKLRERAYTAKAIKAAKIFSQQDIIQTMNIDQIINTLPQKTFDERKRMLENAEKWLASGEDTKMAHAKKLIDALNTLQEQERIALNAKLTGMSDSQRVADAFRIAPPDRDGDKDPFGVSRPSWINVNRIEPASRLERPVLAYALWCHVSEKGAEPLAIRTLSEA